ncbi:MAG: hypothetical protein IJ272_08975 [Clostridia bacterium]|nr:hypothetical protein [Clostridia bacterium]
MHAISYSKIRFEDIPKKYRTREFFIHALSGAHEDIVEYVKTHPDEFDKQFFKDHIATNYYSLEFGLNDFEYMPLDFIDEEMVACAMFRAIDARYVERRGDFDNWFYSVYRRKPEILTQELYTLGARCFATKRGGKNKFLEITPEKYRTTEYYFALCLKNSTPVMEDIPESMLTTSFLISLLNDSPENIQCFTEESLEREAPMAGKGTVKLWQAAVLLDGYQIKNVPLNEERVEFFLSTYDKDTSEYAYGFKEHYKRYIRKKNSTPEPENVTTELAGMVTLVGAMLGMDVNSAIDLGTDVKNGLTDDMNVLSGRKVLLPIHYAYRVPKEYSKKYDREEYLLEIYKKIGIQVLQKADHDYYSVVLPENLSVIRDDYGYWIKNSNEETLIHYYARGPFYDRTVTVDQINVTLE